MSELYTIAAWLTVLHCSMLIISTVAFLLFLDRFGCSGRSAFQILASTYTISAWGWKERHLKRTAAPFRLSLGIHVSRYLHLDTRSVCGNGKKDT